MQLAIIGGTGIYDPLFLNNTENVLVVTPYGQVEVKTGEYRGQQVAFIPRHGSNHAVAPHRINYRANIWALKSLGVQYIVATNAVGSVNQNMRPGDFVLVDQFIDLTKTRSLTFFDGDGTPVVHTDMTNPYCPVLRKIIYEQGMAMHLPLHDKGCYVRFEGPRYETAAEVHMARMLGGDVVGMTNVPEVVLAREACICYATICIVTNMGAGLTAELLTHEEVSAVMTQNLGLVRELALNALISIGQQPPCTRGKNYVSLPGLQDS